MAQQAAVRAVGLAEQELVASGSSGVGASASVPRIEDAIEARMTISEVARHLGITLRTLRFYEAKRLVMPLRRGAVRLYRRCDQERLSLILTGRRLGFTLAEIKELLDRPGREGLNLSREQCVEQINMLERQKRGLEVALTELRQIYSGFYRALLDDPKPR